MAGQSALHTTLLHLRMDFLMICATTAWRAIELTAGSKATHRAADWLTCADCSELAVQVTAQALGVCEASRSRHAHRCCLNVQDVRGKRGEASAAPQGRR
jgi:hypothetical protein